MRMRMGLPQQHTLEWHGYQPSVPHAALRDHMLGKMTDVRSPAAQDCDLHAGFRIEMHVQGPERKIVVLMERIGEPL